MSRYFKVFLRENDTMSTTMSRTSETNAEIISRLASHPDRFVLTGSLARGVLLGADVIDLVDPRHNRFQDVDVIDRTTHLNDEYDFLGGHLGAGVTKVVRPVSDSSDMWGFYDNKDPVDPSTEPVSTFDVSALELSEYHFSRLYTDQTIAIPSARAMLYLSNFFAYAQEMAKHHTQIAALRDKAGTPIPELDEAYHGFISEMELRYPLSTYTRARKSFFAHAPSIAFTAQQNVIGPLIRRMRGIEPTTLQPLSEEVFESTRQAPLVD